jgi:aminodeoxyfutalosine deaminase
MKSSEGKKPPVRRVLLRGAMVVDGRGVRAAPGALLLEGARCLAAGTPQAIGQPAHAEVIDLPDMVMMPALVNAHAHLDLSHIGPMAYARENGVSQQGDGGKSSAFVRWVDVIRARRRSTEQEIGAAVRQGVELGQKGGTAIIGDIAGARSLTAVSALRASGLAGVSFLEVFGVGRRQQEAIVALRDAVESTAQWENGVRLGLQPHAPYSCGSNVYRVAAEMNYPLATHLAETLEELEFVANASGPLAEMLRRFGVWDDSITGSGKHPIDLLAETLERSPMIAVHLNYIEEGHIEKLARWPVSVAYCPRASAYFGHPHEGHPPHRYGEMLDAGVNVALGTDSLVCLDTPERISVLDDMRFLFRRDLTDPIRLLLMATNNGATALGFDPSVVTFEPGPIAGVLGVPIDPADDVAPLEQALLRHDAPRWLVGPIPGTEFRA